jgi:hypothetical protein
LTTPSRAEIRAEIQIKIQEGLNAMEPIDREVLALRHFEELNNNERDVVLGNLWTLSAIRISVRFLRDLRGKSLIHDQVYCELRFATWAEMSHPGGPMPFTPISDHEPKKRSEFFSPGGVRFVSVLRTTWWIVARSAIKESQPKGELP